MSVPCGGDALHGVVGTSEGRDVRDLVLDAYGVRGCVSYPFLGLV